MDVYIGVDIGTTNTKALALGRNGRVAKVLKTETPRKTTCGIEYFDIRRLEKKVDDLIAALKSEYTVRGISFSSVGESVVPVARGEPVHDPLVWYESCAIVSEDTQKLINKHTSYLLAGMVQYNRLGLYKMLWMVKNLSLHDVEYWLPLSSYFIYRGTGVAIWDTSQAGRSFVFNVHDRVWNEELFSALQLPGKLGNIEYMGTCVGQRDGIAYGLSGHDHIAGLYAIYTLSSGGNIVYDSMGSASVLAAVVDERERELHLTEPEGAMGGMIGAAFRDRQYYLLKPFRYFGLLLSQLMELIGKGSSAADFKAVNEEIRVLSTLRPKAFFCVGGDPILGYERENINILNMKMGIRSSELIQSAYVYLSVISRMMLQDLKRHFQGPVRYFAGGAITNEDMFMTYKASMLEEEIFILDTEEISALGSAIAAAAEDTEVLEALKESPLVKKRIFPDLLIFNELRDASEEYQKILGFKLPELFY